MKHLFWIALFTALTFGAVGCSSCGDKAQDPGSAIGARGFETGLPSAEALADAYIEAIAKKDPQLLKKLFLTPDEMASLKQGRSRQIWQAYFMITKRAFMDKNRDYLGLELEKVDFTLGRLIGENAGFNVYRGSVVRFKLPDGKIVQSEINFLIEAHGTWKVLGLKYLKDELKRRGIMEQMGFFEGEAKFKGVDEVRDVQIKIKKLDGNHEKKKNEQQPEQPAQ